MKFIIAVTRDEIDHDASETLGEEVTETETDLVLCETDLDVFHAMVDIDSNTDVNWSLFEVVGGKAKRRTITWVMRDRVKVDLKIG
jgi:hypothetical protein